MPSTLTHNQCRTKVCVVCFQSKKSMRSILGNSTFTEILKANVGQNFDATNPRIPSGLCSLCRNKYFSANKEPFSIPQYLQFVVAPENLDEPCECEICLKVRPIGKKSGLLEGKPQPHAGGRPKSSPPIQKKQAKLSSSDLCRICLVPKDSNHNSKTCNESTKTRNLLNLTLDEQGKPNKTGEKIAGKVLKGMDPSPKSDFPFLEQEKSCQSQREQQSQSKIG